MDQIRLMCQCLVSCTDYYFAGAVAINRGDSLVIYKLFDLQNVYTRDKTCILFNFSYLRLT